MKILETSLYSNNLDQAERFYLDVIGLKLLKKKEGRHLFFKCADSVLIVFNPEESEKEGGKAATHGSTGEGHMAFGVKDGEIENWRVRLGEHSVEIEKETVWEDGSRSLYFRDPDNNSIEIISEYHWD